MSTVIATSTPEFAVLATDTYTRTDSGVEDIDAVKLHGWPGGWLAGAGLGDVITLLAEFLQNAPLPPPADVEATLTVHWRMMVQQNPQIADRIEATSAAVMHAGHIVVIGPKYGCPRGSTLNHGRTVGFAPEDVGDHESFQAALNGFNQPTDPLDAVRRAARFIDQMSRISNDVSGTVDVAVDDRRFRGECTAVAEDPVAHEIPADDKVQ